MRRFALLALLCSAALPALARDISGSIAYRQRIALDPAAEMVVELRGASGLVAEIRAETAGAQVPLPFTLATDDTGDLTLRAALFVGGLPLWVTAPVAVPAGEGAVDLGELPLQGHVPMGFSTLMRCGDTEVEVGFIGDVTRLRSGSQVFDLAPVEAASGAKYADGATPETSFWSKGNRALITLQGVELAECQPVPTPSLLPVTARGNEPGWSVTAAADGLTLTTQEGENLTTALPPAESEGDTTRFAAPELTLALTPALCHDSMTGMPMPLTASLTRGEQVLQGCGGDPASLLMGDWVVTAIGGTPVAEDAGVTMAFAAGAVSGSGGCNRYNAGYSLTGEGLSFQPGMSSMMACEDAKMVTEAAFHAALAKVFSFDIDAGGGLVLIGPEGPAITARR